MEEKKHKITLPDYTLGEELMNSISHGIGAGLGIAALVLCVVFSVVRGMGAMAVVASAVYGSTLIILYLMSCMYHALARNQAKRAFRVMDHCTIYLLIAGTYTPYTLVTLCGGGHPGWGWSLFGVVWGVTVLGITLTAVDFRKFRIVSTLCYVGLGWVIVIASRYMIEIMWPDKAAGLFLLLGGGVLYTVGAVLYAVGKKHKDLPSLFHIFVLGGSILHFLSIFFYVLKP